MNSTTQDTYNGCTLFFKRCPDFAINKRGVRIKRTYLQGQKKGFQRESILFSGYALFNTILQLGNSSRGYDNIPRIDSKKRRESHGAELTS